MTYMAIFLFRWATRTSTTQKITVANGYIYEYVALKTWSLCDLAEMEQDHKQETYFSFYFCLVKKQKKKKHWNMTKI